MNSSTTIKSDQLLKSLNLNTKNQSDSLKIISINDQTYTQPNVVQVSMTTVFYPSTLGTMTTGGPSQIKILKTGVYEIIASLAYVPNAQTILYINVNGVTICKSYSILGALTAESFFTRIIKNLNANDVVTVSFSANANSTLSLANLTITNLN